MVRHCRARQVLIGILVVVFMLAVMAPGQAEASTAKERALEELREAIRALPDRDNVTAADHPAIKEAIRMRDRAMAEYGITEYEICVLSAKLGALEGKVDVDDVAPLPPTGGTPTLLLMGLLSIISGVGLLLPRKRD